MRFQDPQLLWLLLLLIPWVLLRRARTRRAPTLHLTDGAHLAALPDTLRARCARGLPYLRVLVLALAILALARPQVVERETKVRSEAVDLVVALDLSTSMLAEERQEGAQRKNRLAMAKTVLADFIRGRSGDRIALVAFAARPYPAAPLTLDHDWLQAVVARLGTGTIEDGTALGDALLAALNRLRAQRGDSGTPTRAGSQAVILVTDGRSNAGAVPPQRAAAAAKALGIRVHTLGIGSRGRAVIPIEDPLGGVIYRPVQADLDEAVLREIAAVTGGAYFRADDPQGLAQVFREIDRLEKRPIERTVHLSHAEYFSPLLLFALTLLALEIALGATLLRTGP